MRETPDRCDRCDAIATWMRLGEPGESFLAAFACAGHADAQDGRWMLKPAATCEPAPHAHDCEPKTRTPNRNARHSGVCCACDPCDVCAGRDTALANVHKAGDVVAVYVTLDDPAYVRVLRIGMRSARVMDAGGNVERVKFSEKELAPTDDDERAEFARESRRRLTAVRAMQRRQSYAGGAARDFVRAYAEAMVFIGLDWRACDPALPDDVRQDNPTPLDSQGYGTDDIAPESARRMMRECLSFLADDGWRVELAERVYGYSFSQAGHDFALTRNGHGAGFWDRGIGRIGRALTDAAHVWGDSNLAPLGDAPDDFDSPLVLM